MILLYSKTGSWTWNPLYTEYSKDYVDQFYRHVEPETGRRYQLGDLTGPGGAAKGNPSYECWGSPDIGDTVESGWLSCSRRDASYRLVRAPSKA